MLVALGLGLSGAGILANDIVLDLQQLGAFEGISEFNKFDCLCEQDPADVAPGEDPTFSMDNCDLDPNSPGYIGDMGAMVCSWETHESEYGAALIENYWEGEGCDAKYWDANRDAWPAGMDPDLFYNPLFSTELAIYRILVTADEEVTDESLTPMRGRVSSDGVSEGTARFDRESSSEDSETRNTSEDGDGRSTSGEGDFVNTVGLNRINETGRVPGPSGLDETPTLVKMLNVPETRETDYGSMNKMIRQSVAALLNAGHPDIHYFYTEQQVKDIVELAMMDETYWAATRAFEHFNGLNEKFLCPAP